jgi:hypothetical protein
MRDLTLDEKITIKGKLSKKGVIVPKLTMATAVFLWGACYGFSIAFYYKVSDKIINRRTRRR